MLPLAVVEAPGFAPDYLRAENPPITLKGKGYALGEHKGLTFFYIFDALFPLTSSLPHFTG